ncbi:MAG: hypothetical protein HOL80_01950 [Candidatus Magasanikbacteria bacterium]|jgi:hypothetical protein|nr:hypothetical protein [Candidatus Magasanikbacteria bacterium]MBT5262641.1 hypothetical protein [Candidatus Magasanikbacteria bacterium]MBT5820262.1 hypothetical protein [Candidatus Magasanikbacteria bacterium]MBT6294525.1 hypothetical protein [Candidatus Magasanikbacteria bacterium]
MGIFGYTSPYSRDKHNITRAAVQRIISRTAIKRVTKETELAIERAFEVERKHDGKLSLRQVDEVLRQLKKEHVVDVYNMKTILKAFETFFER